MDYADKCNSLVALRPKLGALIRCWLASNHRRDLGTNVNDNDELAVPPPANVELEAFLDTRHPSDKNGIALPTRRQYFPPHHSPFLPCR